MPDPARQSGSLIRPALEDIAAALAQIQMECEDYGGWAGEDEQAAIAADLGHRLTCLGLAVAVHGREKAEGGP